MFGHFTTLYMKGLIQWIWLSWLESYEGDRIIDTAHTQNFPWNLTFLTPWYAHVHTFFIVTLSQARSGWNWPKSKQKLSNTARLNFWVGENELSKNQLVVLYMRPLGQFSNIFFLMKVFYTRKAYKAHEQLLLRYFYMPRSI